MTWFVLALLTAFFSASGAAVLKRQITGLRAMEFAAYPLAYGTPLFLLLLAVVDKPPLSPYFWPTLLTLLPVNMAGFLCQMSAIAASPLSVTMPFLAFTPIITMLVSMALLGETPSALGLAGLVAVMAGSYLLNIRSASRRNLLGPFRAIGHERGSVLMLAAAVIYGLSSVLGKMIVLQSSPLYSASLFFLVHNILLLGLLLALGKVRPSVLLARPASGAAEGALFFLEICCHMSAIALVAAAYMIAIKRLNGLFSVLYGRVLFKDTQFGPRLVGAGLMAAGAACIVLA